MYCSAAAMIMWGSEFDHPLWVRLRNHQRRPRTCSVGPRFPIYWQTNGESTKGLDQDRSLQARLRGDCGIQKKQSFVCVCHSCGPLCSVSVCVYLNRILDWFCCSPSLAGTVFFLYWRIFFLILSRPQRMMMWCIVKLWYKCLFFFLCCCCCSKSKSCFVQIPLSVCYVSFFVSTFECVRLG